MQNKILVAQFEQTLVIRKGYPVLISKIYHKGLIKMNYTKILFLLCIFFIGCVSTSKYDALKKSSFENEKKLQDELKLEREISATLFEEQNTDKAKLARNYNSELDSKQDKYNSLLKEKNSLRSSMGEMKWSVDELNKEKEVLSDQKDALRREKDALNDQKDEMKQDLAGLRARKLESEARITEYKELLNKFKNFIDMGKLKIKIIDGRMVIVLSSDVLFASGSKKLSTNGNKAISEITGILASIKNRKFQIEGHTDSDRFLTIGQTNWDLAADRAINVLYKMVKSGMPETKISAASFGESNPVAPNNSNAHKAQNRRIEIIVVPDLSLLPGYDELRDLADNKVSRK